MGSMHSTAGVAVRLAGVAALYFVIGRAGMLATTDGSGRQGAGMQLHHLYDRASLLGGSMHIDSKPEQGTTITVLCPARSQ